MILFISMIYPNRKREVDLSHSFTDTHMGGMYTVLCSFLFE
jgi:hypothetical protein